MLKTIKILIPTLIFTSCASQPKVLDCFKINGFQFCREISEEEQFQECVKIQQGIYRGFEISLPARCDKFKNRPEMNKVIKQD